MDAKNFFNAVAEKWDAGEKSTQEELKSFLKDCGLQSGKKTLDLACGTGVITNILREENCAVTALDLCENMIAIAKRKFGEKDVNFLCGDFYDFAGSGFEQVVVFNAYPHFLDKQAFVKKLYDVLSPDGCFIIAHNLGRATLSRHHASVADISCELLPVNEEAKYFAEKFDILEMRESADSYLIRGRKK